MREWLWLCGREAGEPLLVSVDNAEVTRLVVGIDIRQLCRFLYSFPHHSELKRGSISILGCGNEGAQNFV